MQLYLSNLVDLALGKPHLLECENYNFLHALLHVMLKKLNMADSRVELTTELASKAERMVNTLPRDPSLCLKEYTLRAGGGKLRKKTAAVICPKKSLIQINRKWPQCCDSSSSTTVSSSSNSCCSSTKPIRALRDIETSQRVDQLCGGLNQRISQLEAEQKKQTEINCTAMKEFQKFRDDFAEFARNLNASKAAQSIENESTDKSKIVDTIGEIDWLKERMLDISESLKMHSECLRKLKCEDLPKITAKQEELSNSMHAIKCQVLQAAKIKESKCELESLKHQVLRVSSKIQEVEKNLETCRQSTSSEMLTLRNEFVDKIKDQMSVTSEIINIENLEYIGDSKCASPKPPSQSGQLKFNENDMQGITAQSSNHSCICPNVTSSIFDIRKQVSSQSICMQQLVRDLAMKLDRCEFQVYCHELSDTIDSLMQLKNDFCAPTAAGGSIPLLRRVNCISCQAGTNMQITASTVPKLRPVKGYPDCVNCCNQTISEANWSCYSNRSGERRDVRGVSRCGGRVKYRRLKTPFRPCGSPILVYKNRFRKNSYC